VTQVPRRAWVEQIMGMPISVHVRGPRAGDDAVATVVGAVFAELRGVDELFSTFKPGSQVSRVRCGELALADCDPVVREVADLCEAARERTGGWFDADLPGPDGGRAFDPTGLVKGWAVQRAARHLTMLDEHDFLVNAGGDVVVGCHRTDTPDWVIGIEDPDDGSRLLASVPLRVGAVATSGTAARGDHIVVPATGRPATGLRSVSVIGPELLWADVYATAAFARGPACAGWLRTVADHVALVVGLDGTTTTITGSRARR
jgi:FAD:protein FMN transferase